MAARRNSRGRVFVAFDAQFQGAKLGLDLLHGHLHGQGIRVQHHIASISVYSAYVDLESPSAAAAPQEAAQ